MVLINTKCCHFQHKQFRQFQNGMKINTYHRTLKGAKNDKTNKSFTPLTSMRVGGPRRDSGATVPHCDRRHSHLHQPLHRLPRVEFARALGQSCLVLVEQRTSGALRYSAILWVFGLAFCLPVTNIGHSISVSALYYYYYKRTMLFITDPKFYDISWLKGEWGHDE